MNLKFLNEQFIFTTREYALASSIEIPSASKQLNKLYSKKILEKISRGIWANIHHPYFNLFAAVPYILKNEQGYISFLTALHIHGIISQIPTKIQIATSGHSRKLICPIGHFEFIHISPKLVQKGINWNNENKGLYLIADKEKALLDTLYISTRKGKKFSSLPELNLEEVNKKYLKSLLKETIKNKLLKKSINKTLSAKGF